MTSPQRVHVLHTYSSDPATVFAALAEHENLGPILGAEVTRVRDGDTSRNGVGSTRRLKVGPLPAFEETTTTAEPNSLIEYRITNGGPLKEHWGVQRLMPTADGGTTLDYTIGFDAPVPGMAAAVAKVLTGSITKGLPRLVPMVPAMLAVRQASRATAPHRASCRVHRTGLRGGAWGPRRACPGCCGIETTR